MYMLRMLEFTTVYIYIYIYNICPHERVPFSLRSALKEVLILSTMKLCCSHDFNYQYVPFAKVTAKV
jgi:hypothetical protein